MVENRCKMNYMRVDNIVIRIIFINKLRLDYHNLLLVTSERKVSMCLARMACFTAGTDVYDICDTGSPSVVISTK